MSLTIYSGPITTTQLALAVSDAHCYYAFITNRIRIYQERGLNPQEMLNTRNSLDDILWAISQWQQNHDGSTDGYDNPYSIAGLNGLVSALRAIVGYGCVDIPAEPGNNYIYVLDFLTDNVDYLSP